MQQMWLWSYSASSKMNLQREPEQARLKDLRGPAAGPAQHEGLDGIPKVLGLQTYSMRVVHIEHVELGLQAQPFTNYERPLDADVNLIQPVIVSRTRHRQSDPLGRVGEVRRYHLPSRAALAVDRVCTSSVDVPVHVFLEFRVVLPHQACLESFPQGQAPYHLELILERDQAPLVAIP